MKKTALFAAVICALCACNKEGEKSVDPVVAKVEVLCDVDSISRDILDNYDIYYDYIDFEGAKHSEQLTGKCEISFSKANPGLSEAGSNPFTIAFRVESKSGAAEKATYDGTYSIKLGINGYYGNGELATGSYSKSSSPFLGKYGKVKTLPKDLFEEECTDIIAQDATTYEIFHCKLTSGEWHIAVKSK